MLKKLETTENFVRIRAGVLALMRTPQQNL